MTPYDRERFDPPAPVAAIEVRNHQKPLAVSGVPFLLDYGADISLLPTEYCRNLDLQEVIDKAYELEGFRHGQDRVLLRAVMAEVRFCDRWFRGQFILFESPWGILGRNILNWIFWDGPSMASMHMANQSTSG